MSIIFRNLPEKSVVPKFLTSKQIIHWSRFADDIMCICRKGSVDEMYQNINNFDHQLKFTKERVLENEIYRFESVGI